MREVYGEALVELGEKNSAVIVLDADVGTSVRSSLFAERYPERYYNMGIAEGNMMAVAAGMSYCGKIPYVNTFAVFATLRAADPLRALVASPKANVKVAGAYGGLSYSYDGATHQSVEDIAIMRSIPNITLVVPTDGFQTRQVVMVSANYDGPVYLRLSRAAVPDVDRIDTEFVLGKANILRNGTDITLIACGYMVHKALEVARIMADDELSVRILEVPTIKPLDKEAILKAALDTNRIVTVEEHNVIGGLGSAVAEVLGQQRPTPLLMIGIPDQFGESGDYEALLAKKGLDTASILERVRGFVRDY